MRKISDVILNKTSNVAIAAFLVLAVLVEFFYPQHFVRAAHLVDPLNQSSDLEQKIEIDLDREYNGASLPAVQESKPRAIISVMVTAYSSTPDQTDHDPFTTAWGTKVKDGIAASNFLPLGAYIKFPEMYGDKFFRIEDKMNQRYDYKIDIWMTHRRDAKEFGAKVLRVEIY